MRKLFTIVILLTISSICHGQQQPNIILINLDDVDVDIMQPSIIGSRFPEIARFVLHGMRFSNMHVTTPLCGPSRACLLRGQYAHNTGIRTNSSGSLHGNGMPGGHRLYSELGYDQDDLSTWMQAAGYRTMLVGKYLNNDIRNIVPAGWDDFYSSRGNLYYETKRFTNRIHPNGRFEIVPTEFNRTVAEMDDVVELIDIHQNVRPGEPFFLYFAPVAAHTAKAGTEMIESGYDNWWPNLAVPRTPDFGEADMSDKLGSMWMLPGLNLVFEERLDDQFRNRILALKTVDDQIGRLFAKLDEHQLNNKTYVFLTSDNGWSGGHHRLTGKSNPYDRATRVPFYAMGPGIESATARHLVAHIDVAPTLVRLASGTKPSWVDGKSFYDLLFNPSTLNEPLWRAPILIENWTSNRMRGLVDPVAMASTSLRFYDESYIEWFNGDKEYYDLSIDPFQLENRYDELTPAFKQFLKNRIRSLKSPMTPIVGLTVPLENEQLIGRDSILSGIAEDDLGLSTVKIAVRDETTYQYWNGTNWQNDFLQLTAELSNHGGQISHWNLPLNIPLNLATDSIKKVWVWPIDVSGNYSRTTSTFKLDVSGPSVLLMSPSRNQVFNGTATITGTAFDESGVNFVRVIIIDRATDRYWNGNEFTTSWAGVNVDVSNTGCWDYHASLPVGRYYVSARGFDEHRNFTRDIASDIFRVR